MSLPPDTAKCRGEPTEPGFYWRRFYNYGAGEGPGWRWAPCEVYRPYKSPEDSPLMCNGYDIRDAIVWGPQLVPPSETSAPGGEPW